jgi:hypothetical protein
MNKKLLLVLAVLTFSSLACNLSFNVPTIKTGPEKTEKIKESLPDNKDEIQVDLSIGAAELNVTGGAADLVNGTVKYNVPSWKPSVSFEDNHLVIKQKETEFNGLPGKQLTNQWDLQLTNERPLKIDLNAGAYQGNLDLGGMNIIKLNVNDGASDTQIDFSEPNKGVMESFDYNSGASTVKLTGLANANFDRLNFSTGAGSYTLDFSGDLQKDENVRIDAGVSTIKIIIPAGTRAEIEVDGEMKDVNTHGTWTVESNKYSTKGSGNVITIYVNMSLGSLDLTQE